MNDATDHTTRSAKSQDHPTYAKMGKKLQSEIFIIHPVLLFTILCFNFTYFIQQQFLKLKLLRFLFFFPNLTFTLSRSLSLVFADSLFTFMFARDDGSLSIMSTTVLCLSLSILSLGASKYYHTFIILFYILIISLRFTRYLMRES